MRECLFCKNAATSHEHYFPDWALALAEGQEPYRLSVGDFPDRMVYRGNAKTKQVCEACNHGWMSDLEGAARRIMGPMIQDISVPFGREDQALIARWCIKTSMVFESLTIHTRKRWFTAEQREAVRADSAVPPWTYVWAARYGGNGVAADGKDLKLSIPDIPYPCYGCLAHFLVNHLLIQVISLAIPKQYDDAFVSLRPKPGPWLSTLVQVWPPSGIGNWPPRDSFYSDRDPTVRSLIDRFAIDR